MKILILDKNIDYSQRFKHYLEKKYPQIQVVTFDNIDSFNKQTDENAYDLVLFDVSFENQKDESTEKIIGNAAFAYISETNELVEGYDTIFKYSSVSDLYNAVCKAYEHKKKRVVKVKETTEKTDKAVEVLTFFPVSGGSGSSTMAGAFSVAMAENSEVLYINMEQKPSDLAFFEGESKKSLTDIISAMKTKYTADSIELILKQVIQKESKNDNLFYIKGCNNIMDFISFQPAHLDFILKILREKFSYRYIVIDADFIVGNMLQKLFALSDKLVFVSSGSDISNMKLNKIHRYLEILGRSENITSQSYIIFNQYYGMENEQMVAGNMEIAARFARYRTDDNTRITTKKIIEEITAIQNSFSKLS